MIDKEFAERWIKDIAPKLSKTMTFDEWIRQYDCHLRYSKEEIELFQKLWEKYKSSTGN